MEPAPRVGALLPRAVDSFGIDEKLRGYVLRPDHERGATKASGFADVLALTIDDANYLARCIKREVLHQPIVLIRDNAPYGVNCVVDVQINGLRRMKGRSACVRTVWEISKPGMSPRLVSAYLRL